MYKNASSRTLLGERHCGRFRGVALSTQITVVVVENIADVDAVWKQPHVSSPRKFACLPRFGITACQPDRLDM
jgi:hypothetical protein